MKLAAEIELPFSEFWELTPYEFNLKVKNYYNKKKEQFKENIILAYLNAKWTIQWLGEKKDHPKPLEEILKEIDKNNSGKEKKIMTPEQMLVQVKVLNALFGGEVKTCNS
ncbi:hypothetical protein EN5CB1_16830 [Tepidimicrobium xylanilyticum]|nr:hypothetical protein EN5CB1_16830 [Tepidimicrobium xylanilyticum]